MGGKHELIEPTSTWPTFTLVLIALVVMVLLALLAAR